MALIGLLSPGGAPGVTTTALALTLAWPRRVVLAECDRSGGSVLPGMWRGTIAAGGRGLLYLALDLQQRPASAVWDHVLPLDEAAGRFVLPGVTDPAQSRQLAAAWPTLAAALASLDADVIADIGRFNADDELAPLLASASQLVIVMEPVIRSVAAARPRVTELRRYGIPIGLGLVGTGPYGSEGPGVIADTLATPIVFEIPADKPTARVLSDGAAPTRKFARSPLMRAAAVAARSLSGHAAPAAEPVPAAEEAVS